MLLAIFVQMSLRELISNIFRFTIHYIFWFKAILRFEYVFKRNIKCFWTKSRNWPLISINNVIIRKVDIHNLCIILTSSWSINFTICGANKITEYLLSKTFLRNPAPNHYCSYYKLFFERFLINSKPIEHLFLQNLKHLI